MDTLFNSPNDIVNAYENGLVGWIDDPESRQSLIDEGVVQYGAPASLNSGAGQRALLWRYRQRYDKPAYIDEPQTTGDCTSHGTRNAIDTTRAIDITIRKQPETYYKRTATEPLYGARGHGGQGADPGRLTRFSRDVGYLARKNYPGVVDLSEYNAQIGHNWGARGVPENVKALCRERSGSSWLQPKTAEEVRDMLFNGYGGHSGQALGFKRETDSRGMFIPITRGRDAWMHDMALVGMDYTREFYPDDVLMFANSWAMWCPKPKFWPEEAYGPWPLGLIVFSAKLAADIIVPTGSAYFYSDVNGYPAKTLPDFGFGGMG